MKLQLVICLMATMLTSCSKTRPNANPTAQFHVIVDLKGNTTPVPVTTLDNFLIGRSLSKEGELFDNRHVPFGVSYQTPQTLVLVSVMNDPKVKHAEKDMLGAHGFVEIDAYSYAGSMGEFQKLYDDVQKEMSRKFPGRPVTTWFEPSTTEGAATNAQTNSN